MTKPVTPTPVMNTFHKTYNIFNMVVPDKMDRGNYLCWRNQFECALKVYKPIRFIERVEASAAPRLANDVPNSVYEE